MTAKNSIRLIASDLDGTLLLGGAQSLSPEAVPLIRALLDRGIAFVASSGRQYANLRNLFHPIRDRISYICENGCLSYTEGEEVSFETMDAGLAREIIAAIEAETGAEVLVSGKATSYIRPKDASFLTHMRDVVGNHVTLWNDLSRIPEPFFKVSLYEPEGLHDTDRWLSHFGDRATAVTGGGCWLDFMPKGVTKLTAFEKLLRRLDIPLSDCLVFGDNDNDREMLLACGHPATVTSAKKEIHDIARFSSDTVEAALRMLLDGSFPG